MNQPGYIRTGKRWARCVKIGGPYEYRDVIRVRRNGHEELRLADEFSPTKPPTPKQMLARIARAGLAAKILDAIGDQPEALTEFCRRNAIGDKWTGFEYPMVVANRCRQWPELKAVKLGLARSEGHCYLTICK